MALRFTPSSHKSRSCPWFPSSTHFPHLIHQLILITEPFFFIHIYICIYIHGPAPTHSSDLTSCSCSFSRSVQSSPTGLLSVPPTCSAYPSTGPSYFLLPSSGLLPPPILTWLTPSHPSGLTGSTAPPQSPSLTTRHSLPHHTILTGPFLAHLLVCHPCPRTWAALLSTMSPAPCAKSSPLSLLNI